MPLAAGFMSFISSASSAIGSAGPLSTIADYGLWATMPYKEVDPDSAFGQYLQGMMSKRCFDWINSIHGRDTETNTGTYQTVAVNTEGNLDVAPGYFTINRDRWSRQYLSRTTVPGDDVIFDLMNRGLITNQLFNVWMTRRYDGDLDYATAMQELRYEIPGQSDLIGAAAKGCFNLDVATEFGYATEVPQELRFWVEANGYGADTGIPIPLNSVDTNGNPIGGTATWFDVYWWNHWETPSTNTINEMLYRLYSDSLYGPSPDYTNDTSFDEDDYALCQKASSIAPFFRSRIAAITYRPLGRADAESLYTLGIIDTATLYHALRAEGYNEANANLLIQLTTQKQQMNLGIDPSKVSKDWICSNYKTGMIADDDAIDLLRQNGFTEDIATGFLNNCKLEIKSDSMREQIRHIRSAFMLGVYTVTTLTDLFIEMNLNPFVYNDLVKRWKLQRDVKIKFASSRQLLTMFTNGAITEADITDRLFNLGYDAKSITTMIYNAKITIVKQYAKALMQQAKAQAAAAKALAAQQLKDQKAIAASQKKAQKIQDSIIQKRIKSIVAGATIANLKTWWSKGLIPLWEILYKLYYEDYTISDAQRFVMSLTPPPTENAYVAATKKAQTQYSSDGNPPIIQ